MYMLAQDVMIKKQGWPRYQCYYRGSDKSLARSGRKQVTATEEFDVHIPYL
jgi:hypothetical protein